MGPGTVLPLVGPTAAVSCLFVLILKYNGPGHSLQWLSLWGLILLLWLSVSIAKQDLSRFRLPSGWLPTVVLAYLGWLVIAPYASTYPYASSTAAWALAVFPLTLVGWLLSPHDNRQEAWRMTWRLLLLGGAVVAVWGLIDFVVFDTRAHGPLIDANAYAALINLLLIPLAFSYLTASASERRLDSSRLSLGLIGLLAIAQFMTQSRGALLALLAILPGLLWLSRRGPMFRTRLTLLLLILILAYAFVKFGPFEQRRGIEAMVLAPEQHLENDPAFAARLLMWRSTWEIFRDSNLLVGTGLGTYKSYYVAYREEMETSGNLAHNDYLQGLQEGGLIQLGFFLILTIFAPLWLLFKSRSRTTGNNFDSSATPSIGLMLGTMAVSLHAFVNFVHYVPAIAMLSGLYLARTWETVRHPRELRLFPISKQVKPGVVKSTAILLLAIPTTALLLDGAIFKVFSGGEPIIDRLESRARFTVQNLALTLRPDNPFPRVSLIRDLIAATLFEPSRERRSALLETAEREASFLAGRAPGLASGRYLRGKTRMLKGNPEDLALARQDLEDAVRRVPPATGMRLDLVKVYQALGQEEEAYRAVTAAKKWVSLEGDLSSLVAFATEAKIIALRHQDRDEANFWSSVSQIRVRDVAG